MGVHENQKGFVSSRLTLLVNLVDVFSGQSKPQNLDERFVPLRIGHLLSIRPVPGDVLDIGAVDFSPGEILFPSKDRMRPS